MATITLKGNEIHTYGELPKVGSSVPNFNLINNGLAVVSMSDMKGSRVVLNIFPSLDTGICASSVRNFNKMASDLENTKVLCISRDLPFAQARFCGAEGIENAITISDFNKGEFGKKYELTIKNGPLANLFSRAIIVLEDEHKVVYTEQVSEIVDEPNYDKALEALK